MTALLTVTGSDLSDTVITVSELLIGCVQMWKLLAKWFALDPCSSFGTVIQGRTFAITLHFWTQPWLLCPTYWEFPNPVLFRCDTRAKIRLELSVKGGAWFEYRPAKQDLWLLGKKQRTRPTCGKNLELSLFAVRTTVVYVTAIDPDNRSTQKIYIHFSWKTYVVGTQ